MPDLVNDQPDLTPPPPAEPPAPTPDETAKADAAPLSEHIEQFLKPDGEPEPTPPRTRHRSQKNLARAEDVPRIKELIKERDEWKAKYEAYQAPTPPTPAVKPYTPPEPVTPGTYSEPEPVLDSFMQEADPYTAYMRAMTRWEVKRDKWEDQQAKVSAESTKAQQDFEEAAKQRASTYTQRLQTYVTDHPERATAFQSLPTNITNPLVVETMWSLADGPDVLYSLLQQPALFHELLLLTDGKPVSEGHVAMTTQWLRARLQAGTTGAATRELTPTPPAPRPPTPVRTRPMPPTDGPPSDSGSLMEHQRYFKTAR